jgi:SAM-dependent methyltransferase
MQVRDRFDVLPGQIFSIVRCGNCRLLYLNPRPDANSIGLFYASSEYDPFISSRGRATTFTRIYRSARKLSVRRKASRVIRGVNHGSKTLDVGCATGEFMIELRRRGFEPFGVEPDPGAAEFVRQQGLKVWTGTLADVPSDAGAFELITFWHVLEHVHDLRDVLNRAHELLSANGQLAIAVPNPLSVDASVYGPHWVAWDTPRHLYHFEPPVMLDLLEQSGFRARRAGAVAFDAFYHSLLSEKKTVHGLLRGGTVGLTSYVRGLIGAEGSSELYLAYKRF